MSQEMTRRKPGRPRNERVEQSILQAARELMVECGVQSFSMDTLALRAGVSKPTVYRRWPTKDDRCPMFSAIR